jgi:hypothetical protein
MSKLQKFLCIFGKRYDILTPIFKQPEIWPFCNIARTAGLFLSLPILGGWWLDGLPARRHFKLIAAIQCTF